LKTESLENIYI